MLEGGSGASKWGQVWLDVAQGEVCGVISTGLGSLGSFLDFLVTAYMVNEFSGWYQVLSSVEGMDFEWG